MEAEVVSADCLEFICCFAAVFVKATDITIKNNR
jgi:hypothetical protein